MWYNKGAAQEHNNMAIILLILLIIFVTGLVTITAVCLLGVGGVTYLGYAKVKKMNAERELIEQQSSSRSDE
jgi:hypothetical protein